MAINYRLEADWLLIWYPDPLAQGPGPHETRMRGHGVTHSTGEFIIGKPAGHREQLNDRVVAFVVVGITDDEDHFFDIDLEVQLGAARKTKHLVVQPGSRIPFMINLDAVGENSETAGTAAVFHGVFVTGARPFLSEFVTAISKVFGLKR